MRRLFAAPFTAPLTTVLFVLALSTASAESIRHSVAPGVEFIQEIIPAPDGPLVINTLRVDLKNSSVKVRSELAGDTVLEDTPSKGREVVGALAARHGAVAAINADFFPFTGDPLGVAVRDGELLSEGLPHRVALGIKADGGLLFDTLVCLGSLYASDGTAWDIDGINRPLNPDELILLTPAYGEKSRVNGNGVVVPLLNPALPIRIGQDSAAEAGEPSPGSSVPAIPRDGALLAASGKSAEWIRQHIKAGDKLRMRFDMVANPLSPGPPRGVLASRAAVRSRTTISGSVWTDVTQAVGGGPWLVRDGKAAVDGVEQGFRDAGFVAARHPRTAVGGTLAGELLLVTVDGRQTHSRGMTLPELADYMLKLGAHQAINLDGGGSTAMVVRNLYVNGNSDGEPRAVANALLVFSQNPESAPQEPGRPTEIPPVQLAAGSSTPITLNLPDLAASGARPIWGSTDGRSFVDQRGMLNTRKAGTLEIAAWLNGSALRIPLTVLPGSPEKLTATLAAAPNNPPDRRLVVITVKDRFGNPIPGIPVTIKVAGGVPDYPEVKTDSAGRAEVEVIWDTEMGGAVTIQSGLLAPIVLKSK